MHVWMFEEGIGPRILGRLGTKERDNEEHKNGESHWYLLCFIPLAKRGAEQRRCSRLKIPSQKIR